MPKSKWNLYEGFKSMDSDPRPAAPELDADQLAFEQTCYENDIKHALEEAEIAPDEEPEPEEPEPEEPKDAVAELEYLEIRTSKKDSRSLGSNKKARQGKKNVLLRINRRKAKQQLSELF